MKKGSSVPVYRTMLDSERRCVLVQDMNADYYTEENFSSPLNIVRMLNAMFQMDRQSEEYVYLLCLDNKMRAKGVFELSHGSATTSVCFPREVFQKALLCNANYIVIAHNHPSGDSTPSTADGAVYRKLADAGRLMGIPCLDSIVIGAGEYYSFSQASGTAAVS